MSSESPVRPLFYFSAYTVEDPSEPYCQLPLLNLAEASVKEAPLVAELDGLKIRDFNGKTIHSAGEPSVTVAGFPVSELEPLAQANAAQLVVVDGQLYRYGTLRWTVEEGSPTLKSHSDGPTWDSPRWEAVCEQLGRDYELYNVPSNNPIRFYPKQS